MGEYEKNFKIICDLSDVNNEVKAVVKKNDIGTNEYLIFAGGRVLSTDEYEITSENIDADLGVVTIEVNADNVNSEFYKGSRTISLAFLPIITYVDENKYNFYK